MICHAKPYIGKEPFIFFSYCHENKEIVYPIIEHMTAAGYRIWYDEGIHPGDEWLETLAGRIEECTVCICAISQAFAQSHYCKNELTFAIENRRQMLVIFLEDFAIPMGLKLQISNIQNIFLPDYPGSAFWEKLYMTDSILPCRGEQPEGDPEAGRATEMLEAGKATEMLEDGKATEKLESFTAAPVLLRLATGERYEGAYPMTSVGRLAEKCDIVLGDLAAVSGHHLDLIIYKKRNYVLDRGSANGTRLNGRLLRPDERAEVISHAELELGGERFLAAFGEAAHYLQGGGRVCSITAEGTGERRYLLGSGLKLGRTYQWRDGVMAGSRISREHGEILCRDGGYYLVDTSTNGTFLNGKRLEKGKETPLHDGDGIRLGSDDFQIRIW